jgi:hypothetical protein
MGPVAIKHGRCREARRTAKEAPLDDLLEDGKHASGTAANHWKMDVFWITP